MNTAKKILLALYLNWMVISAIIITLGHLFLGWSLFALWLIALAFLMLLCVDKYGGPLRVVTWPLFKHAFYVKLKRISPLIAYPLAVELELNGWTVYKNGGSSGLQAWFSMRVDDVCERFSKMQCN